jgi:transcriptional pleiotropic regulator of transition state genes
MKVLGVTRPIDHLGRIGLPKELRDTMDLPENTVMAFFTEDDTIILRKHQTGCVFCGSMDRLTEFGGKNVCECCRDDFKKSS